MMKTGSAARAGAALACGAAAVIALDGCSVLTLGKLDSSHSGTGTPEANAPAGSASPGSALSSPAPSSPAPAWAAALGPGVTVTAPSTVTPGNDSPAAVAAGIVNMTATKNVLALCRYFIPKYQAECESYYSSPKNQQEVLQGVGTYENFHIGYAAVDGTEGLAGITGTYCQRDETPECVTNTDPAAILSSGRTFAAVWKSQVAEANSTDTSSNRYDLLPCVEIGGKWYADFAV
jgi:hypothetical protein